MLVMPVMLTVCVLMQGEKVVRLAQMCHKLEKDQENMTLYCLKEPERTGARTAEPTEVGFQTLSQNVYLTVLPLTHKGVSENGILSLKV